VLYEVIHLISWPISRVFYGFRVYGAHHVPSRGGMILASNHASFLDPLLVASAVTTRTVNFMAKEELFKIPVFGLVCRLVHAVPIRRGSLDRRVLESFKGLARRSQHGLLVFPEGTRTSDGSLKRARRGVGALCRAASVPVVPARIQGTYEVWPRWRLLPRLFGEIEVIFGPPVEWSDEELDASGDPSGALATLIMEKIAKLHTPENSSPMGFWQGYRNVFRKIGHNFLTWARLRRPGDENV
jgi:1-acyl-sn-glycerol-3-phosphate acyltransferase